MPIQQVIPFDNSYATQMEGFFVPWKAAKAPSPKIVQFNNKLAEKLDFDAKALNSEEGAQLFSGNEMPLGASPLAQVYAGHQFGGFSQQLGDGRALLVGEIIDKNNQRCDIQLKGSGPTPFSRRGDGKAVIGPVLREYLISEAMHALGVPTTRALAAVTTGEQVVRNGLEPGAVLTRVASSHIRVGTFQFFAARGETEKVQKLADYSIHRHYKYIEEHENKYLEFLKVVIKKQASLIAKWMSIGFVHGVMNTDNMTISGETIDYGPCAFIDVYDAKAVFSSIDEMGRYAYGNQPNIAQWNLARFAETLIKLIDPNDSDRAIKLATDELNEFPYIYQQFWLNEMQSKLGMMELKEGDAELINELFQALEGENVDYTRFFRSLSNSLNGDKQNLLSLFKSTSKIEVWLPKWEQRISSHKVSLAETAKEIDKVNPIYIPRNHKVEEALEAASRQGDYKPFKTLLDLLSSPYDKRQGFENYETSAPNDFGPYVTFCGT